MRSADHYRKLAARTRREAQTATDPSAKEQLESVAAEYEAMAAEIEQQTNNKTPTKSD